jgi:hypothetical protein
MRSTAILTQTEQKRLERSVRQAEKRGRRAWMARIRGLIRPTQGVSTTADTAMGKKLLNGQNHATLLSDGRPLGEYLLK